MKYLISASICKYRSKSNIIFLEEKDIKYSNWRRIIAGMDLCEIYNKNTDRLMVFEFMNETDATYYFRPFRLYIHSDAYPLEMTDKQADMWLWIIKK